MLVPALTLQPLLENAVKYAVAERPGGGVVAVRAFRNDGRLRLEVEDNGPGLASGWKEGVGLGNLRSRLEQLYGDQQSFVIAVSEHGGVTVRLEIPWRLA